MIEEELRRWARAAGGERGWVLIREGKVVGVFRHRKDAIAAAREPGVYLLINQQ